MKNPNSKNSAGPIAHFWEIIQRVLMLLEPTRFSFIVVGLLAFVFLVNDQGMEILRALGESFVSGEGGAAYRRSVPYFGAALILLSLANWYFPRLLLDIDYPDELNRHDLTSSGLAGWRKWTPRFLGIMPPLLAALGFWRVGLSYDKGATEVRFHLWGFAGGCLVLAAALWIFFVWRRRWLEKKQSGKSDGGGDALYPNVRAVLNDPLVGRLIWVFTGLATLAMLLFAFAPVVPAQHLGGGAILLWGMANWVFLGSALSYFGSAYRFPSLLAALAMAGLFSRCNDNHQVRPLDGTEPDKPSVSKALDDWHTHVSAKYPMPPGADGKPQSRPIFLVAAAGGGIRAAYWTALVLADLEDSSSSAGKASFASHTFALSGVSGGALGAAVFDGALVEPERPLRNRVKEILDDDFLAPALGRMLFPDFLQRFLPVRVPSTDRAEALELGWEKAWDRRRKAKGRNPLAEDMLSLWSRTGLPDSAPHLLLNGTMVESGKRVLTSDLLITSSTTEKGNGEFLDVDSAAVRMKSAPVRLSTAAHASARFTYVSPAGTFADGKHLVDGGYFENSGATTALDVLKVIEEKKWGDVIPIVILIDNGPQSTKASGETPGEPAFFAEVLSPLQTMLSTREARGKYAEEASWHHVGYTPDLGQPNNPLVPKDLKVIEFRLANREVPLPLGWMLSRSAATEMNEQLDKTIQQPLFDNPGMRTDVVSYLPPKPAPAR